MGGNVFKGTEPFDHSKIDAISQTLNNVIDKLGVRVIPIGSTATPTPGRVSGDFDVLVDETVLARMWNERNPRNIRKLLKKQFDETGLETTLNGVAVHVKVPVDGHYHQADILVVPHAEAVSRFHIHCIPAGSPYKGVNKHLAMNYLARKKGLLWSAFQGLYRRDSEGKRGDFITDDIDRIAYILLGVDSTVQSLDSLESMIAVLPQAEADEMMQELVNDPSWKEFA